MKKICIILIVFCIIGVPRENISRDYDNDISQYSDLGPFW